MPHPVDHRHHLLLLLLGQQADTHFIIPKMVRSTYARCKGVVPKMIDKQTIASCARWNMILGSHNHRVTTGKLADSPVQV